MKNTKKLTAAVLALMLLTSCGAEKEKAPVKNIPQTAAVSAEDNSEYVYCVASVSKIYVTTAIMQLADEGKIDIDKPVTEYIPEFTMADERCKDITVRMLMDHTSGIMGSTQSNGALYDDNDTCSHDRLLEVLSTQRLKADPGKYAAYCNDGFDLLEIIVENVSGMTYTDYIKENISGRLGLEKTGTPVDMPGAQEISPNIKADNALFDTQYSMVLGTGGVYSTASDNAKFGAALFTGDDTLISDEAKAAMSTRWTDKEFYDKSGLGWDDTDIARYQQSGVKAVSKGGDSGTDHACLLTAPDEQISVSVLSSGGSSTYNTLIAQSLMDIALEEKGISVTELPEEECTTLTEIPKEYEKFAGQYIVNILGSGDMIYTVSFPENKYMHIEETTHRRTSCKDYLLTTDGDFAELACEAEDGEFDTRLAAGYSRLSFEENTDGTYIKIQTGLACPSLGYYDVKTYCGQKIEENSISDDVINSYKELEGKALLLCSDKYSSTNYDFGTARLYVIDEPKGYVFTELGGFDNILKMTDAEHLGSFTDIPSSGSRDMLDVTIERDEKGVSAVYLSSDLKLIPEDRIPEFDMNIKQVKISENAQWYNISDSIANISVTVSRPENSAVYVYNKFGEVIYTTHNKNARKQIPMPKGGKVLFLGEKGSSFDISL